MFNHTDNHTNLINFNAALVAEEVIQSFPIALIASEETSIRAFVKAQYLSGNWDKIDSFSHFGMLDIANALWDWKRKVTMTNNGAEHQPGIGFNFLGAQWVDSNFNGLSNGVNYVGDDALLGVYVNSHEGANGHLVANIAETGECAKISLSQYNINSFGTTPPAYQASSLLVTTRENSTDVSLMENGAVLHTRPLAVVAILNQTFTIGAGTGGLSPSISNISSFVTGGGLGFNHTSYYDELLLLNNDLVEVDVDAKAIFTRMPVEPTLTEKIAINNFVVAEKAALNWDSYENLVVYSGWSDRAVDLITGETGVVADSILTADGIETKGIVGSRINSLHNPFNFLQNSTTIGVYVKTLTSPITGFASLFGLLEGGRACQVLIDADTPTVFAGINSTSTSVNVTPLLPDSIYSLERTASNIATFDRDGVQVFAISQIAGGIPNGNIWLGARNGDNLGLLAKYGAFFAGTPFTDKVAQSTNLRNLLTALGAI